MFSRASEKIGSSLYMPRIAYNAVFLNGHKIPRILTVAFFFRVTPSCGASADITLACSNEALGKHVLTVLY